MISTPPPPLKYESLAMMEQSNLPALRRASMRVPTFECDFSATCGESWFELEREVPEV